MTFTETLRSFPGLPEAEAARLLAGMQRIECPARTVLLREGQADDRACFVEQGLVRSYFLADGVYRTFLFSFEGDMATGFSGGGASRLTVEAAVDSVLYAIPRRLLGELYAGSAPLANWGRLLAEKYARDYEHYFLDYFWADKAAQYRMLVREHPRLLQMVPLRELASYLGITPQSLSRIRARMR